MTQATAIPINVFESERELIVVAPMPDVAPEDITIDLTTDGSLTLRPPALLGQERIDYLVRERSYGPYERTTERRCIGQPRTGSRLLVPSGTRHEAVSHTPRPSVPLGLMNRPGLARSSGFHCETLSSSRRCGLTPIFTGWLMPCSGSVGRTCGAVTYDTTGRAAVT